MSGAHHDEWVRLGDGSLPSEDQDIGLGHIVPIRAYKMVFSLLLVLTLATVWAADQDFGTILGVNLNLGVALGIATLKAAIVTLFFMHLNWEGKVAWGIVIYPLFIFTLILGGTLGDAIVRIEPTPPEKMLEMLGKTSAPKENETKVTPAPHGH